MAKFNFTTAIITWATMVGGVSVGVATEFLEEKLRQFGKYKCVIAKEEADEEINQDHLHCYIDLPKRGSFREKYFDIPTIEPVYVFVKEDGSRDYLTETEINEKNIDPVRHSLLNNYKEWKKLTAIHPNIQPLKSWGSKYHMLKYVTKMCYCMRSNFNVDNELDKLLKQLDWLEKNKEYCYERRNMFLIKNLMTEMNINSYEELIVLLKEHIEDIKKKNKKTSSVRKEKDDLEYKFCSWLRDRILNSHLTRDEIQKEIVENEEFNYTFLSKFYNYKSVLDAFFKAKPNIKPPPYYGIFFVPEKLYNYLKYLDEFIENWYTNPKKCETRPKACFVSGDGDSGKTSLFRAFGDCCYWCNIWNYDAYESKPAFNLMDDYDGSGDSKENQVKNNFCYLKPWFGGQQVVCISGKFKKQTTVANGRPLVFISNYKFIERFPEQRDRKYLNQVNCTVVDIPEGFTLKEYPKTTDLEILSMNWMVFDTRDTWWYKNKVLPQQQQEQSTITTEEEAGPSERRTEIIEISSDIEDTPTVVLENDEEDFIIIKSEDDDDFENRSQGRCKRKSIQRDRKGKKRARGY